MEERAPEPEICGLPAIISTGTIRRIAEDVARRRGNVRAYEIMNLRGGWRISHARHEVMWLARQLRRPDGGHRFSFPQIGRAFGMDHTTALHGFRQHDKVIRAQTMARVRAENEASALAHGGR